MTADHASYSRRGVLERAGLATAGLLVAGLGVTGPAGAPGHGPGGGGVGYITDVGLGKLDGGDDPFEFTGVDLGNDWLVPRNCQHPNRDQKPSNNVQIANADDGTTLGLLLPKDRNVPGSGPNETHNLVEDCGVSESDSRNRDLVRVNFKPATPHGPP